MLALVSTPPPSCSRPPSRPLPTPTLMPTHDDHDSKLPPPSSPPLIPERPHGSFVYPVRSLLNGVIQPASPASPQPPSPSGYSTPPGALSRSHARGASLEDPPGVSKSFQARRRSLDLPESPSHPPLNRAHSSDEYPRSLEREAVANAVNVSKPNPSSKGKSSKRKTRRPPSPNFRDFPADGISKGFSTASQTVIANPQPFTSPVNLSSAILNAGPAGEPVQTDIPEDPAPSFNPRRPPNFTEVAADAFTGVSHVSDILPGQGDTRGHVSMADTGIVHLLPVASSRSSSASMSQGQSSAGSFIRSAGSSSRSRSSAHANSSASSRHGSMASYPFRERPAYSPTASGGRSAHTGSSGLYSSGDSAVGSTALSSNPSNQESGSNTSSYPTSEDPYVTFRYKHKEDVDGHHVVVGREGKLTRCEDEPIRTPGAVQGFGVLVAVQENAEEDTLLVRQVSENSTEILGLSPKYLFSLPCFTDVFPDSQVDVLWDNIQFLTDGDANLESEDDSPHVFLISGWGEPGSVSSDEVCADRSRRRTWSCWCAAHRPKSDTVDGAPVSASQEGLIILEFELERDVFNPLYPSMATGDMASGVSSPDSNGAASTGSTDTSGTLVSEASFPTHSSTTTLTDSTTSDSFSASPRSANSLTTQSLGGLEGDNDWAPTAQAILESTTNHAKPLLALERIRKMSRLTSPGLGGTASRSRRGGRRAHGPGIGMMDVFAVMAQINEQLGAANDLDMFLNVVVGVIKDLTQFHRVLVYQFDESWNGQTVAELVDWNQSHDLYRGLHFPASDIPAQARQLYTINKMRLLYDRQQTTARLVVRNREDLETPLNMTHCYLRAMSPIHLKYLGNMGVRSSMSVSIMAFGQLWGLIACHSYGEHGIRVSFPVRQMLRLLSDSVSRNIERLSYAQRLHTRKLVRIATLQAVVDHGRGLNNAVNHHAQFNTMTSDQHPTGYIVSNADDLLGLFDADFGVLVIGEGAKILGPNQHGQEVLIVAEYLRLKQFNMIQVSQAVTKDFPDLQLSTGLEIIAGLLYVPLSSGGKDFIAFLRKGQPRSVHWAGKPFKEGGAEKANLEPRRSFKVWSETVAGRCRNWTDEQLETAGVLSLVYGKFIEVWRQKETALQTTKLTNILLSNAGHEGRVLRVKVDKILLLTASLSVRTPLNHIIKWVFCLELALNGKLDLETRENLHQSHAASKSLLFTINDLLDLTRLESGNETSFNEPFDLPSTIEDATNLYRSEAQRRGLGFNVDVTNSPGMVIGDASKVRTVVANVTANALKYTREGEVTVICRAFEEPQGLRNPKQVAVEIIVGDTGCGIPRAKLESIFCEFEQVESAQPKTSTAPGLGLGLAVVARIVEQLGGQLRVDSKVDEGSRFSFLIPFSLWDGSDRGLFSPSPASSLVSSRDRAGSRGSGSSREVDDLVHAISTTLGAPGPAIRRSASPEEVPGSFPMTGMGTVLRPVKVDGYGLDAGVSARPKVMQPSDSAATVTSARTSQEPSGTDEPPKLRVLIVEDNNINRMILAKRLTLDGHTIVSTTNGQEGLDKVMEDQEFDCILMDVQMPILNGFEATERIRCFEASSEFKSERLSHSLNGRIPIFAVSASLLERQREELRSIGIDGWILKPIDFKRLSTILCGVTDLDQRKKDEYQNGHNWEIGGWLRRPSHA
ncbi:hypothetical protein EVG20_g157 [Dentipellis fragilis]|uniref:Phytochrome n=1 Tax=Dentipellis fragilis TaxID=205917 RepID=A0A4Y9ZFT1_9AGAM|nr:hypothetical protein EVG20_g157 [Dentipellis fragilis]